jgi:hypothetical protein
MRPRSWVALPIALLWGGCLELGEASAPDASSGSDASDVAPLGSADGALADGGAGLADVAVIDPFDAPDGFEASGPPPPPTCASAGFACVPVAPAGWIGPFSLYDGNLANAPSCGGVTQLLAANSDLAAVLPAQCAACTCNDATGATCGDVMYYGQRSNCTGTSFMTSLALGVCRNLPYGTIVDPDGYAATRITFTTSAASGGTCAPTVAKPTPTKPPTTWDVAAVGCTTLVSGTPGCTAGEVCSAIPEPPFDAKLCIGKDGDVPACPGAPYSRRVVFYKGTTDTRDCDTCACDPPPSATCASTVTTSSDSACAKKENVGSGAACLARDGSSTYYYTKVTATPPVQKCAASGGAPHGTVTPASPVTVCCEP